MTPSTKRTHNLYFLRLKSKHFTVRLIIIIIAIPIRLENPIMIKNKITIRTWKWIEPARQNP
jgi:hypothetical protein